MPRLKPRKRSSVWTTAGVSILIDLLALRLIDRLAIDSRRGQVSPDNLRFYFSLPRARLAETDFCGRVFFFLVFVTAQPIISQWWCLGYDIPKRSL